MQLLELSQVVHRVTTLKNFKNTDESEGNYASLLKMSVPYPSPEEDAKASACCITQVLLRIYAHPPSWPPDQ